MGPCSAMAALEQYVGECLVKCAQAVLSSRVCGPEQLAAQEPAEAVANKRAAR